MAADFHPTSSSGVQVDGNGQSQLVRGCLGRAWLFLHGSPARHAPDSVHPSRARLPDTRTGRWVGETTAVEDTSSPEEHTSRSAGGGGGVGTRGGEGGRLGPKCPSGRDAHHLRQGGVC